MVCWLRDLTPPASSSSFSSGSGTIASTIPGSGVGLSAGVRYTSRTVQAATSPQFGFDFSIPLMLDASVNVPLVPTSNVLTRGARGSRGYWRWRELSRAQIVVEVWIDISVQHGNIPAGALTVSCLIFRCGIVSATQRFAPSKFPSPPQPSRRRFRRTIGGWARL